MLMRWVQWVLQDLNNKIHTMMLGKNRDAPIGNHFLDTNWKPVTVILEYQSIECIQSVIQSHVVLRQKVISGFVDMRGDMVIDLLQLMFLSVSEMGGHYEPWNYRCSRLL